MKGLLLFLVLVVALVMAEGAIGQDPGEIDSLAFGNPDGSPIVVSIDSDASIPIWMKCDENIAFTHICLATQNEYVTARLGGIPVGPMLEWDVSFTEPADGWPEEDLTSQSLLGIADFSLPEPNYINTNYGWVTVGEFIIHTTDNPEAMDQQSPLFPGEDPMYGVTVLFDEFWMPIVPAMVFSQLEFMDTYPPEIISPPEDTLFALNGPFPFSTPFIAIDNDQEAIVLQVDFPYEDYDLIEIVDEPGYVNYQFEWTPSESLDVDFQADFIATDINMATDINSVTFEVKPVIITVTHDTTYIGYSASVEISLELGGYNSNIGGFNLLITWDGSALTLEDVEFLESLDDWEYTNIVYDPVGPGSVRLVGIANLSIGGVPPFTYGIYPLARLDFMSPLDPGLEGLIIPLVMPTPQDLSDNVLSDSTGYLVFHPRINEGSITFLTSDDFFIGDINLNGFPWEVGDAVVFADHLIDPISNPFNARQRIASDCNQDGIPETIADLIFLLGVINDSISPPLGGSAPGFADIVLDFQENSATLHLLAAAPAGGVLVKISHPNVEIDNIQTSPGLELKYNDTNDLLTVIVYSPDSRQVIENDVLSFDIVGGNNQDITIEAFEVSDTRGRLFSK